MCSGACLILHCLELVRAAGMRPFGDGIDSGLCMLQELIPLAYDAQASKFQVSCSLPVSAPPLILAILRLSCRWSTCSRCCVLPRPIQPYLQAGKALAKQGALPLCLTDGVQVRGLQPGVYAYQYLVDGKWLTSPDAPVAHDEEGHLCNQVVTLARQILEKHFECRCPQQKTCSDCAKPGAARRSM